MEAKEELQRLSEILLDFDEVKAFSSYIERMKPFRGEDESEEFSNIKHAFICIAGENKHLKERAIQDRKIESLRSNEILDEIHKIKKFIKKIKDLFSGYEYFKSDKA